MVALNFDSPICHTIDGLIDHDGGMWLSHDLVDLVALGADEERDHALWDENDYGKGFPSHFLEDLVDVAEETSATLILSVHVPIVNLS